MRVRSPSTTLTLTMTVSPGSNGGMVLPSLVICSCSSSLIRFMASSVGCAGLRGACRRIKLGLKGFGSRSFYDKDFALSPFRAGLWRCAPRATRLFRVGPAGAGHIGGPQVGAALPGDALGLGLPPGRHL